MRDTLKPIEKIGINRCIMANGRLGVVIAIHENSSTIKYNEGDKETIKFGELIDPLEAPIILVSWK
jgi:hypothetical protein